MEMSPQFGLNYVAGQNLVTSDDSAAPLVVPGTLVRLKMFDRSAHFVYVKAGATVAAGQCLSLGLNHDDADVDAAAAVTEYNMTGSSDFTADEFGGMGGMAIINAGGGLKFGAHYIKRNSASILYTDRLWGEALTTASDFLTHMMNKVVLSDTAGVATKHVAGVAISAMTSGYYGWIQVSGVHYKVRAIGSADPAVIGEGVQSSSTAGACRGWTAGGTAAEEEYFSFGMALCSDAEGDTAGEGIPVLLTDCLKFWL